MTELYQDSSVMTFMTLLKYLMSRVAMPAKYSQYPQIIAIFLVSPYSTLNQTKLSFLCSQKSFKHYIDRYSLPGALPTPLTDLCCTFFSIPVSPLPCIGQTETCFYQPTNPPSHPSSGMERVQRKPLHHWGEIIPTQ